MAGVVATVAAVALNASAAEVPQSPGIPVPPVPESIAPKDGSTAIGVFRVTTGTQTYTCDTATGTFGAKSTPEARLAGAGGLVHHFAGPSWQYERDGSSVTGTMAKQSPREGTIPELLLTVTGHGGTGLLDRADQISRLQTSGGLRPTRTCSAGETVAVPYKAIYVFWDAP
ncbi:Protein of unknown function [Actinoplanes philippinensis]|uniref:DUF3455 domain-containing protein n=2 Tax=Actinoplanes philippinensis TaxID=35752 RepID=A0A1I2I4R9_9ACTN|nr:Protein of unknown function [Actinoplanes philippinensis]